MLQPMMVKVVSHRDTNDGILNKSVSPWRKQTGHTGAKFVGLILVERITDNAQQDQGPTPQGRALQVPWYKYQSSRGTGNSVFKGIRQG